MIVVVVNVKGDVNIVGFNVLVLLRYIRVVGVEIDLRVVERIWVMGVVLFLLVKKVLKFVSGVVIGSIGIGGVKLVQGVGVKF